jgi:hypothetical protein
MLDILSLMSIVDVMIFCYDELSFTIDEIVIDDKSISISKRSEQNAEDRKRKLRRRNELKQSVIIVDDDRINNVLMIKYQKGKHCIEVNEDQISEGRAHCRSVIEIDGNIEKLTNA